MSRKVWGLIPARLDSSRLFQKVLKELHGLPMVVHVAKRSQLADNIDEVIVCTDSTKIIQTCFKYDIKVCITPDSCKNGTERILAAKKRLDIPNRDLVIDIQGDDPLVTPKTLNQVADYIKKTTNEDVIAIPHIELCPASNKNVVKVVASGNKVIYLTRSDAPYPFNNYMQLKKHLSVIGFSGESLEMFGRLSVGELEAIEGVELLRAVEGGMNVETFLIDSENSFSVDVIDDFQRAERSLRTCPIFASGY